MTQIIKLPRFDIMRPANFQRVWTGQVFDIANIVGFGELEILPSSGGGEFRKIFRKVYFNLGGAHTDNMLAEYLVLSWFDRTTGESQRGPVAFGDNTVFGYKCADGQISRDIDDSQLRQTFLLKSAQAAEFEVKFQCLLEILNDHR